jgi:small conductance mechanosensitive channel
MRKCIIKKYYIYLNMDNSNSLNKINFKKNLKEYSSRIFIAVLIIIFFYILSRIIYYIITKTTKEKNINKLLLYDLINKTIEKIIVLIGIICALVYLGMNLNSFLVLFGSIGFAIAISIQTTITQIVSGGIILFFDYFNIKDLIEVNNNVGFVSSFNLLNTTITDYFGIEYIIPNTTVVNGNFTNYFANKYILSKVFITISNSNVNSIDYKSLVKNLEQIIINECEYVVDTKKVNVKIFDTSSFGTTILLMFLIENVNFFSAQFSARLIARDYLSKNNIILLDESYLSNNSSNNNNNNNKFL